jgi:hypothetical protein
MRVKFLTVLVSVVSVLPILLSNTAQASVHKILLSNQSVTDPETGAVDHLKLNPSGEVTLTYTNLGLKLEYVNRQAQSETLEVYVEFPPKPEAENEQQSLRNDLMEQQLRSQGKVMAGQLLRSLADGVTEAGGELALLIDNSRVIGFRKDHVTMENVTLLVPGMEPKTLAQLLFNVVGPQVEGQAAAIMEQKYKKNPIGFMDGLQPAPIGGPKSAVGTCEALFVSTAN